MTRPGWVWCPPPTPHVCLTAKRALRSTARQLRFIVKFYCTYEFQTLCEVFGGRRLATLCACWTRLAVAVAVAVDARTMICNSQNGCLNTYLVDGNGGISSNWMLKHANLWWTETCNRNGAAQRVIFLWNHNGQWHCSVTYAHKCLPLVIWNSLKSDIYSSVPD